MSATSTFLYRAARPDGVLERGHVEAESRDAAASVISGRGLFPVEIQLDARSRVQRSRLAPAELALGLRVLATLIESGLPIARALTVLEDLVPPSWRGALPSLRSSVREGQSLATALAGCSLEIPSIVIGIVRAGEAGSGLGVAVKRAAELMESVATTRAAIRSALAYPLILAVAGIGSMVLLVGVVLPRFATILADLGQSLPATTRLVLSIAATLRAGALPTFVAIAVGLVLWRAWVATERGRRHWHEILLSLPLLGSFRLSASSARVAEALATLLDSGVPIAAALPHAAHAAGDAAIAARILAARERIVTGSRVAAALVEQRAVSTTTVRLVHAGEESGQLATMLAHAARLEGDRAATLIKSTVNLMEPGLILLFGGVIALVAASLLQAVYAVRPMP